MTFTPAQRARVLKVLEPHLAEPGERDAAVQAVERAAFHYLFDLNTGFAEPERPAAIRAELERVRKAAQALADALDALSEPVRDRLTEYFQGAAVLPGHPPEWAPMVPPALLERLPRDAGFLAGRASMVADLLAPAKLRGGRPSDGAARALVLALAAIWERFTHTAVPRGDPARTPWGRFVTAVLADIGADGDPMHLARVVAAERPRGTLPE